MYRILEGDVVEQLKTLADASVDAIVTDPPYELGFMGKAWDQSGIACNVEMWQEALRVLKPGGHCLAFGGSRTYHRLACAIEDAGFEIRDQIMWIYGSGFPKSLDVSKAIDKAAGACREVVGVKPGHKDFADRSDAHSAGGRSDGWERPWKQDADAVKMSHMQTAPATDAAKQWSGWGTALKPAHEPIVVARKPLIGTVAANVLEHGTGALNIDGCRVETNESTVRPDGKCAHGADPHSVALGASWDGEGFSGGSPLGRWPANVIHDGSEEVVSLFPDSASGDNCVKRATGIEHGGQTGPAYGAENRPAGTPMIAYGDSGSASRFFYKVRGDEASAERTYADTGGTNFSMKPGARRFDEGSPARFFYCAKADKKEREAGCSTLDTAPLAYGNQAKAEVKRGNLEHAGKSGMNTVHMRGNTHPTVKPVDLMAYFCRLVTPPNGTVLDCFMGSGSTGIAALREGLNFIGIEINPAYVEIARRRIEGDAPLFNAPVNE